MSIDHSNLKLGKRPRRHDVRTLKMARYMTSALPAAPARVDYTHGIEDWGMMLNDQLGCCTIAAVGHAVQTWTANALGRELTVPDSAIRECYEKWDGYNPADPSTDQGGVELDVLKAWRQQGFDGNSLDAFVAIELDRVIGRSGDRVSSGKSGSSDQRIAGTSAASLPSADQKPADHPITGSPDRPIPDVAAAIWLFGGAYIGVEFPITAQNQDVWDVPAKPGPKDEPGSWGGHAVYLVGYDTGLSIADCRLPIEKQSPDPMGLTIDDCRLSIERQPVNPQPGILERQSAIPDRQSAIDNRQSAIDSRQSTITCITWGKPKKMTWAWFEKYCSEAYALVSKDWLQSSGVSP